MMATGHNFSSDPLGYMKIGYDYILTFGDPRTKDWPLIDSPMQPVTYVLAYLVLVWAGPKAMANRKAYSLSHWLTLYNFFLVGLSSYMTVEFFLCAYLAGYNLGCQPIDYSNDPLALRMARVCWVYYFSKYIEILDTVFFILRKKTSQITFLHVYHHASMIFNWWMVVYFIPGGATYFHAMINSFVHVIMYSYYGLAALGPALQPFIWWKKYVTKLQMGQFLIILVHTVYNIMTCEFPMIFAYLALLFAIKMVLLFSNFYFQEYYRREKTRKNQKSIPNEENGSLKDSSGIQDGVHKKNSHDKNA